MAVDVQLSRRPHLAEVAQPSDATRSYVERFLRLVARYPLPHGHPLGLPSVEEPDAEEPARPDLWGARVSNDPGLPDHAVGRCAVPTSCAAAVAPPSPQYATRMEAPAVSLCHGSMQIHCEMAESTGLSPFRPAPRVQIRYN